MGHPRDEPRESHNGIGFSERYKAWIDTMWPIEPIHCKSHASPTPLLFQNAIRDQCTNVQDAIRYQDTASEPKRAMWYDSEHWPLPDEVVADSVKWLRQFIGPLELKPSK